MPRPATKMARLSWWSAIPGFRSARKEEQAWPARLFEHASWCSIIAASPRENVIGDRQSKIAIETLNEAFAIGAQMIGLARGALDHAVAYARERKRFGKPIGDFQGVQFDLAKMATDEVDTRLLVCDTAPPCATPDSLSSRRAAMAKYYSSEIAEHVASKAVRWHHQGLPIETLYRDTSTCPEGTSNIQLLHVQRNYWASEPLFGGKMRVMIPFPPL